MYVKFTYIFNTLIIRQFCTNILGIREMAKYNPSKAKSSWIMRPAILFGSLHGGPFEAEPITIPKDYLLRFLLFFVHTFFMHEYWNSYTELGLCAVQGLRIFCTLLAVLCCRLPNTIKLQLAIWEILRRWIVHFYLTQVRLQSMTQNLSMSTKKPKINNYSVMCATMS